jgi:hypothetical protein
VSQRLETSKRDQRRQRRQQRRKQLHELRKELPDLRKRPREQDSPAIVTVAVTALFLIVYVVFWAAGEANIQGTEEAFIDSFGYHLWSAMAALSATLWVVLFVAGLRTLGNEVDVSWRPIDWFAKWTLYVVFIILGGLLLWAIQSGTRPPIPIGWWDPWSYLLPVAGAVTAGPWVLLVWRAHEQLHQIDTGSHSSIDRMTSIWSHIESSMLALSLLVTSATLTTGALRIAVTAKGRPAAGGKLEPFIKPEDYPASGVLLYGAFFTILLAVAVFPLVFAWRSNARRLVDSLAPVKFDLAPNDGGEGEAADDKRSKLEKHFHLDAGLFQSPLTALSVVTPLLTSVLAVFIPELAQ